MILTLASTPAVVGQAVEAVRRFALGSGLDEAKTAALGVAVDEAVTNIVRHAYHGDARQSLTLMLSLAGDAVQVELLDQGLPFDPLAGSAMRPEGGVENREVGGLGLLLMRELVDEVRYMRDGDRNKLMLRAFVRHSPVRREPVVD